MRINLQQSTPALLLSAFVGLASLCGSAAADTIFLTDGSSLKDVRVRAEGLLKVEYKGEKGNKVQEVASDRVLSIEFARKPTLVDQAEQDVLDDLLGGAVQSYEEYIEGVGGTPQRNFPWAPAYAMYRLVELHEIMGENDKVIAAVDHLVAQAADSRYVPLALLKKAEAAFNKGSEKTALSTVTDLSDLVSAKGLSEAWTLECKLRGISFDSSLKGKAKRSKLEALVGEADSFPIVRNRTLVALGESWLEAKKISEAQGVFSVVVEDPTADGRTLAAAYMGMGDCLFQTGMDSKDAKVLNEALLNYLRIVVSHKNELRYVPRAMFQAGRVFQALGTEEGEERAQKLYLRLLRNFRGSRWADEARGFRK